MGSCRGNASRYGEVGVLQSNRLNQLPTDQIQKYEVRGRGDSPDTLSITQKLRGAQLKDVQEILGHADIKMTMRYSHLSPAHLRATVDRLDGLTESAAATTAAAPAPTPVQA